MLCFFLVILFFSKFSNYSKAEGDFDVRRHLSTVTRYGVVKDIVDNSFVPSVIPEGCVAIHLNLVARHGTRSPTEGRIRELDGLEAHLKLLISNAEKQNLLLDRIPSWLHGWESPWKGQLKGGELIRKGEEELYDLGIKTRENFPNLFEEEYHPEIYTINATRVPRTTASALAFAKGLFNGNRSDEPGKQQAFSVSSGSNGSDILLRFFDYCTNYKNLKKKQEPVVNKLKEPYLDNITYALVRRYGLNFTRQDISSLWFLCQQEASLLDITNQACGLFMPSEITLLEWTDDLELYILKGYGNSPDYRMATPLLEDIVKSMEQAIQAKEEKRTPGSCEKARLRFAHAETLVPLSCLLGLFLEGSEFEQIQEQPWQLPVDPQIRKWRGSIMAPFAGNNMLALYSCPATHKSTSTYFVRLLHNEHPIPMPACHGSDFCPFEVFKEKVYGPYKKHTFDTICNEKEGDNNPKDEL
ncbi:hypothetical protein K1719_019999 [Acacia pycnantha]|nr:hypothetical protein K1719_019999 [Acacia pycnantha]